jgi:hypothetical protein
VKVILSVLYLKLFVNVFVLEIDFPILEYLGSQKRTDAKAANLKLVRNLVGPCPSFYS